jgi:DNA-binding MarR family transcriptional regulator
VDEQNLPEEQVPHGTWVFLTNHAHVLLCIARDPQSRTRDIADRIGITERATQRILADLIADQYATRTKTGRRNHYKVNPQGHLRHPTFRNVAIGDLLDVLTVANWASDAHQEADVAGVSKPGQATRGQL